MKNDEKDVVTTAYNELIKDLFGDSTVDVSTRMVTRKDYKTSMLKIQEKHGLEEGHPKFLEWTLTLAGRSPRFIDRTSDQKGAICPLPEEWKPKYTQDLISKLKQPKMLQLCGEWVLGVLHSSLYWNRLRRRIDMMAFAIIQEGRTAEDMRPHEQEPITADMMFSALGILDEFYLSRA